MRKILLSFISLLFLVVLAMSGYIGFEAYKFLKSPPETPGQDVYVNIEPGETFYHIAENLAKKNIITNVQYFRILARYKKQLSSVQAGEFRLSTGWRPTKVLETLVSGKPILYKLSIPEGLPWWQVADIVEKAGYATYEDFERTIKDPELLKKYNIPFNSAEGFLFPETYMLKRPREKNARPIVELLLKTFWEKAAKVWPNKKPAGDELKKIIIFASLVEKETGASSERARIAGVYAKRLRINMLLQCDPTIIYGLGRAFDGNITKKHLLDASNPYNTYKHGGLPPGPICSPGLEALKAAVNPEEHDYLYFVSMQNGEHYFSKSLREHNNAVRKYQLRRRKKK